MNSTQRIERIEILKKQAALLRPQALNGDNAKLLSEYYEVLKEIEKVQRIEDGFHDIMAFATNYFVDVEEPYNLLHKETPSPPFHYQLAKDLREVALSPTKFRLAECAPRSHSKTTWTSNIFPIWIVCYQEDIKQPYWMLINAIQDGAKEFLDTIKMELEGNELLKADFGDLKGDTTWNSFEIVTANNVKISAHGTGEKIRGKKFNGARPNLILDDMESDDTVSTPNQIDKTMDYFRKVCIPMGDPKKGKIIFIGTILHYKSILNQVITNFSDWKAKKYKAIEKFPDRMDLWNEWEMIYHDRSVGDTPEDSSRISREKAIQFYKKHKREMHKGAKVLWPERMDLLTLMEARAQDRYSYNTEYQNTPIDAETRVFKKIWTYKPEEINIKDLDIYGACDPSLGKTKRADASAILTLGRHRRSGILYVLDVDNKKQRKPDEIIQAIFQKAIIYEYVGFNVETVAFQEFFKDEVVKRSAQQGIYIPVKEFKSTTKKEIRISALEPLMTNGQIRVLPSQRELIEELEYFPKSTDNLLDALVMAADLAKRKSGNLAFGHV
jgi:predicted phage terminase large subunit-like protein